MKAILTVALLLSCLISLSQERYNDERYGNMAGIMVSSGIDSREIKLAFCHGIAERWSIGAAVCMDMDYLKVERSDELTEHANQFDVPADDDGMSTHHIFSETVMMQFWTRKMLEGMFLMMGGRHIHDEGMDCTIGIGYVLPVWKGLSAILSLENDLIRSIGNKTFKDSRAEVGLSYKF